MRRFVSGLADGVLAAVGHGPYDLEQLARRDSGFTVLGFVAARWRRPDNLAHLDEWGLGGRNFGPWITWFLLGGDLYTAYTFVAVPALIYGAGAAGFFASSTTT